MAYGNETVYAALEPLPSVSAAACRLSSVKATYQRDSGEMRPTVLKKQLSLYDAVVVSGRDLYEGKILN